METVEATVRIDAAPSGKRFQGVWLELEGGGRLLIAYRALGCWTPFDGVAVVARGEHYAPEGQAIMADHFRLHELRVVEPDPAHELVAVGPEQTISGRFAEERGEPGTKQADSTWMVFVTDDGTSWQVANPSAAERHRGEPARVQGRSVEWSPYRAHAAGLTLWLLNVWGR